MSQKPDPGAILLANGCPREALPFLTRRVQEDPANAEALSNLAVCNRQLGCFETALALTQEALLLDQNCVHAWACRGSAFEDLGRFGQAEVAYGFGVEASNSHPNLMLAHAQSLMRLGRFEEAWPGWEVGRFGQSWQPAGDIQPWTGEDLTGKRLLVLKEGGYGDGILFARWLPRLAERAARVSFLVWDSLAPLLSSNLPAVDAVAESDFGQIDLSEYDLQVPLMSLPRLCGMKSWGDIPPMPKFKAKFNERLSPKYHVWDVPGYGMALERHVGLCWRAEEHGINRPFRSVPVGELEPLKGIPGIKWYSLCPRGKHLHRDDSFVTPEWLTDLTGAMKDWSDTAAFIANLDLVVTVDTAVAHLSAAMGRPTIMLNPVRSDWKWGGRWYDSMTIVQQSDPLSWLSAVKAVRKELEAR